MFLVMTFSPMSRRYVYVTVNQLETTEADHLLSTLSSRVRA
jgi:hypothetical protein